MMMSTGKDYCRICFTSTKKTFKEIDEKNRENFYSLTNVKLLDSSFYSNLIYLQCDKKIDETRQYRDTLKSNELRLIAQLPEEFKEKVKETVFVDASSCYILNEIKEEKESSLVISEVQTGYKEVKDEDPSSDEWPEEEEVKISIPKRKIPELDEEMKKIPGPKQAYVNCPRCSKKMRRRNLRGHIERVHLGIDNFICDLCGNKCFGRQAIEEHMKKHLSEPLACLFGCGQTFANRTLRKAHTKEFHRRDLRCVCEICGRKFTNLSLVKDHIMKKHEGFRIKCHYPNCSAQYQDRTALKSHIQRIHEIRMEPCDVCGKIFKAGDALAIHKRMQHSELRYQCQFCDKKFRIRAKLKAHESIHTNTKKYLCKVCNATFAVSNHLSRHMRVKHRGEKFFCEVEGCQKKFVNRENLRAHLRNVHKELKAEELKKFCANTSTMKPVYVNEDKDKNE